MFSKSDIPNFQENILLANHTTFRIGGPARYFFAAKNKNELMEAVKRAKAEQLPYFIFGGGSNLLVSDKGFEGLAIKFQSLNFEINGKEIMAEAGVPLALLLNKSLAEGLTGLEWATGIPGTLGGAICGNAGAYRHSLSESIAEVEIFDTEKSEIQLYSSQQCYFAYRESVFKKNHNLLILSAKLELEKGDVGQAKEFIRECLKARKEKIPPFPSAGSVFKNIEIALQPEEFQKLIPPEKIKDGMVAVGYLIEQCGLAGKQIGGAQISTQHANFIVNTGGAKAADVWELIAICQNEIKEKFRIEPEKEIRSIGS